MSPFSQPISVIHETTSQFVFPVVIKSAQYNMAMEHSIAINKPMRGKNLQDKIRKWKFSRNGWGKTNKR